MWRWVVLVVLLGAAVPATTASPTTASTSATTAPLTSAGTTATTAPLTLVGTTATTAPPTSAGTTATTAPPTSAAATTVTPTVTSAPQEDIVKLLVGQVLDELVKLCESSLRASTAHVQQAFTARLDAYAGQQRKLEAGQQRKLEQAFDSFRSEVRVSINGVSAEQAHIKTTMNENRRNLSGQQRELGHRLDAIVATQNLHEERFNSSRSQVQEEIEELATEQEQLQVSVSDVVDQLPNMNSSLENLNSQCTAHNRSIRTVSAQQANLNESLSDLVVRHDTSEESLSEVLSQQLRIREAVSDFRVEHTGVQESLSNLSSRQTNITDSVEEVIVQQSRLEPAVTLLTSQDLALRDSVDRLSGQQEEFHVSVRALLGEQAALCESSRSAAQQRIEQHESTSESRLAGLAQQLTAVESTLQYLPHYLGYPCQSSAECSEFVSNSTCGSNGLCACSVGFHRGSSVVRCEPSVIGDPCSADSHCQIANAVCRGGTCRCPEGRWSRDNLECRASAGLNQPCSYQGDCSATGGSCVSGRCACNTRTIGSYEYRLGNGTTCKNGRVELRRSGSSWGYVCDDGFTALSAQVFCRSLGFSGGAATCCSQYGGSANFHMDDVRCTGTESHLMSCQYYGWDRHNCGGGEVVSVQCG